MDGIELSLSDEAAEEEMAFFHELGTYNDSQVGPSGYRRLFLFARDGEGRIVAGLNGYSIWRWLHVERLVVKEGHRGQGLGSRLLAEAEREAARRDCIGVHLETSSFQALPFYEKQGYEVFGQIDDYPPGHTCYFLKKQLRRHHDG